MSAGNYTADLCRVCDGRVECAPTAILLVSLVHTLYGHLAPEPDYFGARHERRRGGERGGRRSDERSGRRSDIAQRVRTSPFQYGSSSYYEQHRVTPRKKMQRKGQPKNSLRDTLMDSSSERRVRAADSLRSTSMERSVVRKARAKHSLRETSVERSIERRARARDSSHKSKEISVDPLKDTMRQTKYLKGSSGDPSQSIDLTEDGLVELTEDARKRKIQSNDSTLESPRKRKERADDYLRESSREGERIASREGRSREYDFIVVGGGTAGCALASRLSENWRWKVLLLEAGPEEPKLALIPGLTSEFKGSSIDWQFSMRPKKGFCQLRDQLGCEVVQGRVLGGTSSINDMAYMRGNPADYDEWALLGNEGWSFSNVLSYFKYSEGNYDKDITRNKFFHSTQGPLDVGRYPYVDDNVDILLSAFNELGYNYTDINGRNQLGFTRVQTMSYSGERVSAYTAFIEPIRNLRKNLEVITEALVTNVILRSVDNTIEAEGVEYFKDGTKYKVAASKEVILSAGAISTPKLLMLSGLGPKEYLDHLNLPVFYDLPVGSNLQDHLSVCLPIISLGKTATTTHFGEKLKDITTYYGKGVGPLSANFQVVAYIESSISPILGTPDIELRFRGHESNMYYDKMDMCVSLLTPSSRGQIVLNATDPYYGKPLIYPNFLKHPTDEKKLVEGIKEAIRLFDTDVFKSAGIEFNPRIILNNECKNNVKVVTDFWKCIIKHFSAPLHNYVGTCKMGPAKDPEAVVDSQLKVYGVSKLRVVDASIMPKITRGSTAAPVLMIAEKASELIKASWN